MVLQLILSGAGSCWGEKNVCRAATSDNILLTLTLAGCCMPILLCKGV